MPVWIALGNSVLEVAALLKVQFFLMKIFPCLFSILIPSMLPLFSVLPCHSFTSLPWNHLPANQRHSTLCLTVTSGRIQPKKVDPTVAIGSVDSA